MTIRMLALTILASLGIACSHAAANQQASKDHTGAMWTLREKEAQEALNAEDRTGYLAAHPELQASQAAQAQPTEPQEASASSGETVLTSMQGSGSQGESMGGSSPNTGAAGGSSPSGGSDANTGSGSTTPGSSDQGGSAAAQPSDSGPSGMGKSSGGAGAETGAGAMGSTGGAAKKGTHHVAGKLSQVSSDSVTVTPKKGAAKTLKVTSDTKIMMNGKSAQPTDLKEGQQVRASWSSQGGEDIATMITAGKAGSHARKGSKGASGGTGSMGGGSGGSSGSMK
jgi:hypothetical protein